MKKHNLIAIIALLMASPTHAFECKNYSVDIPKGWDVEKKGNFSIIKQDSCIQINETEAQLDLLKTLKENISLTTDMIDSPDSQLITTFDLFLDSKPAILVIHQFTYMNVPIIQHSIYAQHNNILYMMDLIVAQPKYLKIYTEDFKNFYKSFKFKEQKE